MELNLLNRIDEYEWEIPVQAGMNVPGRIFASEELIKAMDLKVHEQLSNVASLPGIVKSAFAMPDAHWGYGFPIGGVAAFDPEKGGVISAGGVGFDISCGVRLLSTGLKKQDIETIKIPLADALLKNIPAGVGSHSHIRLTITEMDDMLRHGAHWAVKQGYGENADLERIEEQGSMSGALPEKVSDQAKERQKNEMGTLGSGNHYLELQIVDEIFDGPVATQLGLEKDDVVISIHCGSRGLGHQIGTDYLRRMVVEAKNYGITLPDRELASAPILSPTGQDYLGAMRSGINCALANRQILTHFVREVIQQFIATVKIQVIYDVSHNTCKEEWHRIDGKNKRLFVHRKGATRAFGPNHSTLPNGLKITGQPVIIGGSMGTSSYVLVGTETAETKTFSSSCHGAGRSMSRTQATKHWRGRELVDQLAEQGIIIRSYSQRGVAEEAPLAYKDINAVIESAHASGISKKVARLIPKICIKG